LGVKRSFEAKRKSHAFQRTLKWIGEEEPFASPSVVENLQRSSSKVMEPTKRRMNLVQRDFKITS
jgi:hypothetical protein